MACDTGPTFDEASFRDIVAGKRAITEAERRILLRSPDARRRFYFLADVIRAEAYVKWRRAGMATTLHYRAAASSSVKPVTINNPDFTLTLFPLDNQGKEWTLHIRLSESAMELIEAGIRVVDDRGELWIAGRPDADGELSANWRLGDSPLERLYKTQLSIQPL